MWFSYTTYTDDMPAHSGGITKGPFVFIRPKYKDDVGLHQHEYTHVKQWWVTTAIACLALLELLHHAYGLTLEQAAPFTTFGIATFPLLYEMVAPFRKWCEVQAYRVQIATYRPEVQAQVTPVLAKFLAEKYDLDLTPQEAEALLKG